MRSLAFPSGGKSPRLAAITELTAKSHAKRLGSKNMMPSHKYAAPNSTGLQSIPRRPHKRRQPALAFIKHEHAACWWGAALRAIGAGTGAAA